MSSVSLSRVEVPDIGDFDDVPVIEILVAVGDTVAAEDPLVTLESDKATMDVPAPFGGIVREISVSLGDHVSEGSVLMSLEAADGDGDAAQRAGEPADQDAALDRVVEQSVAPSEGPEAPERPQAPEPPAQTNGAGPEFARASGPAPGTNGGGPIYASPSARRLARELGVDLRSVSGSGRKGRITKEDVQSLAQRGPAARGGAPAGAGRGDGLVGLDVLPWPSVEFEKFGPVERVARSRIQRISAPNLARNWVMIPHVTHDDEADITDLEAWRQRLNDEHARAGVKFTMVAFLVAACVAALQAFPDVNASLDGDELVRKRYYNIGFAADTPGGLVVPVIRGADCKGLTAIAGELSELSAKAREGKLSPDEMRGATFTISSLGGIGGTSFTPIINAPEVAILGVSRAAIKPVWDGSAFQPRLMVPLSLSYDHRVIDGASAARFVVHLVGVLSDLKRALL
jgi:pyruvate dehydrogenase E2 component (dihydrolipoyllysine-residue acetyltransferase)